MEFEVPYDFSMKLGTQTLLRVVRDRQNITIMSVILICNIPEISTYLIFTCFRSRTYQFDDFLAQWTEKLRGGEQEATIMTVRLTKDVDKYKVRSIKMFSELRKGSVKGDYTSRLGISIL